MALHHLHKLSETLLPDSLLFLGRGGLGTRRPIITPSFQLVPFSARESPEERETRRRANADAMREARARESREEGATQRRANIEAMREARARESREEGATRWRTNTEAMREARARRIADRGWKTLPVHRMPHPHPLRSESTVVHAPTYTQT